MRLCDLKHKLDGLEMREMNMTYCQMKNTDIERIAPHYIEYWNAEGDDWTFELVRKRILQVLSSPDAYCMLAEDNGTAIGFAMGRFETFSDVTVYNLVEIFVASEYQNGGIGAEMMTELENRVRKMGATAVQLVSFEDEMHEHFYAKLGYRDAAKLKFKVKRL